MKLINKHIITFGRLFLLLFFLANSGFTVVLYHCTMTDCTMTDEMSGMSCCTGRDDCTAVTCQDMDVPETSPAHLATVDQPCQTVTVAGGYQIDPTVVEKQINGSQIIKTDLLPTSVYETAFGSRVDLSAFYLASSASKVSPPSVETYVLNASFLI